MDEAGGTLNGFDTAKLHHVAEAFREDPERGRGDVSFTSRWTGTGEVAETDVEGQMIRTGESGGVGGADLVLASLSACVVATVARRATLMGLELEDLACQVDGHVDLRRYVGADGDLPGYDHVGMTLHVKAPDATEEQLAELRRICEGASPVGGTFLRAVDLDVALESDEA